MGERLDTRLRRWDADERGTASMEMLLTLPFIFILLVLVVDLGYGWIIKSKTNTAARFAATVFVRAGAGGEGRQAAERALREHYSALEIRHFEIDDDPRPESLDNDRRNASGWNWVAQTLSGWLASLSSRQSVALTVERSPIFGTLVNDSPVTTFYALDGNTWTYDEVPLSFSGLVDKIAGLSDAISEGGGLINRVLGAVARFFSWVVEGFFWLLGMVP